MIKEEDKKDIELCKDILTEEISKVIESSENVKERLGNEVMMSIVYLKIFKSYLPTKNFDNIEEAFKFMNDIEGIINKIFYVSHYLSRIEEFNKKK